VNPSFYARVILKALISLLSGGVFYASWLAVYLLAVRLDIAALERGLFILAPVVTAAGFASGTMLVERLRGEEKTGFVLSWVWALLGCAVGALAVYWYGPMLIVFTMLAGGTLAVAYRDITKARSRRRHSF
jgi:hypothetical protein